MPCSANDETNSLGNIELKHHGFEFPSSVFVLDLSADADPSERRHQHKVATWDTDVGREGRTFGSDSFLDDLYEDFISSSKDLLDRWFESRPTAPEFTGTGGAIPLSSLRIPAFVCVLISIFLIIAIIVIGSASVHDLGGIVACLTEVLRFDVADVQEPVPADAEIDEGRLDTGLDVDNFSFVDVPNPVILAGSFGVEFFEDSVLEQRNAAFFRLRNVDEHFLLHRVVGFLCMIA